MKELVSVIVPVYNVQEYLARCLDSLINQTYTNLEIIIVNDGSTDKSGDICEKYKKNDNRISVIHKKNGGLSSARNAGMNVMKGTYFTFIDSDDFIKLESIENWIYLMEKYKLDVVVGWFKEYYGEKLIDEEFSKNCFSKLSSFDMFKLLFNEEDRITTAWGKLFKTTLFSGIKFDEERLFAEDMFYFEEIFSQNVAIGLDKNVYYYYNQEGVSLVRSNYTLKKLDRLIASKRWLDLINKKYPELHDNAFGFHYKLIINEFTNLIFCSNPNVKKHIDYYTEEIINNYKEIKDSKYISFNDKFKSFFIRHRILSIYKLIRRMVD